jgi:CTP:molybdopterin cytidylyltransferase MocA
VDATSDVVFPVHADGSRPGHPVLFSARARSVVEALPEGDTLRSARDDVSLLRLPVPTDDRGAYLDLDNPEQWAVADA